MENVNVIKSKNQLKREARLLRKLEMRKKRPKKRSKVPRFKESTDRIISGSIIIDMNFNDLMNSNEKSSLAGQLARVYALNRRSISQFRLQYLDTNKNSRLEYINAKFPDSEKWNVSWIDDFESGLDSCIYLTADSESILECIEDDKTYIIGGLVDRNRHKGVSKLRAEALNIRTARLPIKENITLRTTHILTVYHVFEILLKYKETKDWKISIESTLPKRKLN